MPLEESIWVKTSECKSSKASDLFSNKNRFTLLVFSKFTATLEAHGLFSKKNSSKNFRGLLRTPGISMRTHQ
jgi:hypothetical protein